MDRYTKCANVRLQNVEASLIGEIEELLGIMFGFAIRQEHIDLAISHPFLQLSAIFQRG